MEKNIQNRKKQHIKCKLAMGCLLIAFFVFQSLNIYADTVTIVLDPGHGVSEDEIGENQVQENGNAGTDESQWGARYHGVNEKDMTLVTALAMKNELEKYSEVHVLLTRETDKEVSIRERCEFALENEADYLISLHYNASKNHELYGAETWISAYGKNYVLGYGLADCFMNRLTDMGFADRGIKTKLNDSGEDYYGIIRYSSEMDIPALVVEHCYMDEMGDYGEVDSEDELKNIGISDALAVADFCGLGIDDKKAVKKTVSMPVLETAVMPDDTAPSQVKIRLLSYDSETGQARIAIEAVENESHLMYYAFSLDDGKSFSQPELWEKEVMDATVQTGTGFSGKLIAKVWNNYDLESLSNELVLNKSVRGEEEKEVGAKGTYEFSKIFKVKENAYRMDAMGKQNSESAGEETYGLELGILVVVFAILLGAWMGLSISLHIHKKRKKRKE